MDIIVQGIGKKYYTPDQVEINLEFYTIADNYEDALERGTYDVQIFIRNVLEEMQISKEMLKTRNFKVYKETRYDYEQKKNIQLGYAYTQGATLKLDYSIDKVAQFMEKASLLQNPPKYRLNFYIKDIKQSKNEALAEAYIDAKQKAEAIANAAGKELKECIKIDFRPFEERIISKSSLNSSEMILEEDRGFKMSSARKVEDTIQTIFTPEDIEISENLYCLWITN